MKTIEWIAKWMLTIALGVMLQEKAIDIAATTRGYEAYGGEYTVLPLVIIVAVIIEFIWRSIRDIK